MHYRLAVLVAATAATTLSPLAPAAAPTHVWSRRFGDPAAQSARAVALAPSGDIVSVGEFFGTIDFGDGPLTSAGDADIFVATFDPSGAVGVSRRFGDASVQRAIDTVVDAQGRIYTTGFFSGTVDFGGGALSAVGSNDVFVARFGAGLAHEWSARFGDGDGQYATGIALDSAGNVYLCGYFSGGIDFGGGLLTASGFDDVFLAKFTAAGGHVWSKRFGNNSVQSALDVAVDPDDNVVVVGQFLGTIDFGGGTLTSVHVDAFAAKFAPDGTHLWSKRFGSTLTQSAQAVAIDDLGSVFLAGVFSTSINFGGGALTSAGADDIFLAKLDAAGAHVWSKRFGDASATQVAEALTVDRTGRVTVVGQFRGSANFGDGVLTSAGLEDGFAAQFTPDGTLEWSARFGDAAGQFFPTVVADPLGDRVLAGNFSGSVDFGGGPLASAGDRDAFLTRLNAWPLTAAPSLDPDAAELSAFPNPFNPSVTLRATLPSRGHASLSIYDAAGRRVAVMFDGELPAGTTTLHWAGETPTGRAASGVYFARLDLATATAVRKLVLLK